MIPLDYALRPLVKGCTVDPSSRGGTQKVAVSISAGCLVGCLDAVVDRQQESIDLDIIVKCNKHTFVNNRSA